MIGTGGTGKTMSMLSTIIPVISDQWLGSLLENIAANDAKPDEILIVDNSGNRIAEPICVQFARLPIVYIPQEQNIGVNASWNLGLKMAKNPLLCVLNDDIVIPPTFFSATLRAFQERPESGFIVPRTIGPALNGTGVTAPWHIGTPADIKACYDAIIFHKLKCREGWAFTVRRELITPIPSQFVTFCGDNIWFAQVLSHLGVTAVKLMNNVIYHHGGVSTHLERLESLKLPSWEHERQEYCKYIRTGILQI